ncbi:hypothetical protein SS50377_28378 [Spironucleus salmonicida]|uniref:Uncharacterized protein n=1 Tax=Spironucleus salmonicida TaxID=348837 RepID=A0A9P8LJT8_9EUKA|nr:hypothetical protein SS50377_28378 [Spironucleus salmonicida]
MQANNTVAIKILYYVFSFRYVSILIQKPKICKRLKYFKMNLNFRLLNEILSAVLLMNNGQLVFRKKYNERLAKLSNKLKCRETGAQRARDCVAYILAKDYRTKAHFALSYWPILVSSCAATNNGTKALNIPILRKTSSNADQSNIPTQNKHKYHSLI